MGLGFGGVEAFFDRSYFHCPRAGCLTETPVLVFVW